MAVFKDGDHLQQFLGDLWSYIIKDTDLGGKLKEYGITYKFIMNNPTAYLYVDHEQVVVGDEARKLEGVITMELSGDTVHAFWLKKIKLPVALATRKIKSKGPIPKVLRILPALKPVYEAYPQYCEKYGLPLD